MYALENRKQTYALEKSKKEEPKGCRCQPLGLHTQLAADGRQTQPLWCDLTVAGFDTSGTNQCQTTTLLAVLCGAVVVNLCLLLCLYDHTPPPRNQEQQHPCAGGLRRHASSRLSRAAPSQASGRDHSAAESLVGRDSMRAPNAVMICSTSPHTLSGN